jgi:hypothetical protein
MLRKSPGSRMKPFGYVTSQKQQFVYRSCSQANILFGAPYDEIRYKKGEYSVALLANIIEIYECSPVPVCSGARPYFVRSGRQNGSWRKRSYAQVSSTS